MEDKHETRKEFLTELEDLTNKYEDLDLCEIMGLLEMYKMDLMLGEEKEDE